MEGWALFLQQLLVICRKEIFNIWKDPATRRIVVVPAIVLGFLFGYAANYNLKDAPYVAVDMSHSQASGELLSRFDGTSLFHAVAYLSSPDEIGTYITRGDAVMAITIPQDFQNRLDRGDTAPVQIITDGRNTMIAGLAGADVSGYASGPFDDVQAGSWYAPYVNWAAANHIVSGTSATTFDPNATISRQDMAVMLYNYAQRYDVTLNEQAVTPFTDESAIADYALSAVQALHRAGVISGMPDGSFQPQATTTREQACVVLCAL